MNVYKKNGLFCNTKMLTLFTRLIIRLFQLVFSAETVFFSHNKLINSIFLAGLSAQPNGAIEWLYLTIYLVLSFFDTRDKVDPILKVV
jgi:hypothetical protein